MPEATSPAPCGAAGLSLSARWDPALWLKALRTLALAAFQDGIEQLLVTLLALSLGTPPLFGRLHRGGVRIGVLLAARRPRSAAASAPTPEGIILRPPGTLALLGRILAEPAPVRLADALDEHDDGGGRKPEEQCQPGEQDRQVRLAADLRAIGEPGDSHDQPGDDGCRDA